MTSVPPDFNKAMERVWQELYDSMPQSGKVGMTVKQLLQQYKERCRVERMRQETNESPLALLPVSFGHAKDWLMKQQSAHSIAIEAGTVNEEAREVVSELREALSYQPPSITQLLEQPARTVSPLIPTPQFSLGPEPVTDETVAEERRLFNVEHPPKKRCLSGSSGPSRAKKAKIIPPELKERQERASARMLELGVATQQASINCMSLHSYIHVHYFLFPCIYAYPKQMLSLVSYCSMIKRLGIYLYEQ